MSSVIISGDSSGTITVSAPAVAGTNTLTLQAATATNAVNTRATAVVSTSGTSIDFNSLPSWIKKITVMLSGVSTNGTANYLIQIGSGSVTTSGYLGAGGSTGGISNFTTGFGVAAGAASVVMHATMTITNVSGNIWLASHVGGRSDAAAVTFGGGSVTLSGTLDQVRITTSNGTDTFDAGTVNILYEG